MAGARRAQVARELKLAHVWSWGWAQRDAALERSGQDVRRVRVAVGSRREPVRRADDPRPRARRGLEDRPAEPAGRNALHLRLDTADGVERRRAREGDAGPGARADRARRSRRSSGSERASRRRMRSRSSSGSCACGSAEASAAYRAALAETGASLAVARGIIGDELRARDIVGRLVGGAGLARRTSRASARRSRRCSPASSSSRRRRAGSRRGAASRSRRPLPRSCSASRPDGARRSARSRASSRSRPLDDTTALARYPPRSARPAIVRELRAERRADAYAAWTIRHAEAPPRASSSASGTDCPSSASSTSRRTRRSSRSTSPRRRAGSPDGGSRRARRACGRRSG